MFEVLASTVTIMNPQVNTAIHDLLLNVLNLALLALISVAASALNNWRMSLKSGWKKAVVTRLVAYAEQKVIGNEEKQDYVASQLAQKFPRLKKEEIAHLIEEAVINLKLKEAQTPPAPKTANGGHSK